MEGPHAAGELNFDRATYGQEAAGPPCASCNQPLGDEYWEWASGAICAQCRGKVEAALLASHSRAALGKAVLLGGGAALGLGVAYAVFVQLTDYQLALITIGIAFVLAKVIRHASGGLGGRRYQVLAVALTYVASALGYAPAVIAGFKQVAADERQAPAAAASAPAPAAANTAPVEPDPPGALSVVLFVLVSLGFVLAAPILSATEAPIGLLIVGFGLWEAWRLTRGLPLTLAGPYRRTAPATGPPA